MSEPERLPDPARRYALIELDEVSLLLPQRDLHSIEPVLDVDVSAAADTTVGEIRLRSGKWPVFCPSDDLEPLAGLLPLRRICAMLSSDGHIFGVACRSVTSVVSVKSFPVPHCMLSPGVPLGALALCEGRIVCVTRAELLYANWSAMKCRTEDGVEMELGS